MNKKAEFPLVIFFAPVKEEPIANISISFKQGFVKNAMHVFIKQIERCIILCH